MHRFGRSAQQKLKDRWGGSFILATILALVGAWFAGSWLNDTLKTGESADGTTTPPGVVQNGTKPNTTSPGVVSTPESFNLYMVQVGAFRSEASAQRLARQLTEKEFTAVVAPRNSAGLYKVYAGVHTTSMAAQETRSRVLADGLVKEAWTVTVGVNSGNDSIPVMANTSKAADLKKGLDAMKTFLFETAMWMDNQGGDLTVISTSGQSLTKLAADLSKMVTENPSVAPLANLAKMAGENAVEIQAASKAAPGSVEFQKAMTGYMAVLDNYRSIQTLATR